MGKAEFKQQLEALGHSVREPFTDLLVIDYTIESGREIGRKVRLGFYVPATLSFPDLPPGGPIFNPHLLDIHPGNDIPHPGGGVHYAKAAMNPIPIGDDWQYWSRPFPGWQNTDRNVSTYLAHIRHLLDTL